MPRGPIKCQSCGEVIKDPWPSQVRCTACAEIHRRVYEHERYAEHRRYQKKPDSLRKCSTAKKEKGKSTGKAKTKAPTWDLTGKSADQVTAEARALSLSYGVYVCYCRTGQIERYCNGLGIDGLQIIDNAWKQYQQRQEERQKRLAAAIKEKTKSTAGTAPRV